MCPRWLMHLEGHVLDSRRMRQRGNYDTQFVRVCSCSTCSNIGLCYPKSGTQSLPNHNYKIFN